VKAIAVSSVTRLNAMPDLPTIAESGYPGFQTNNLQAIFVPTGTPADIVNKLNAAAVAALKTPDAVEKIAGRGSSSSRTRLRLWRGRCRRRRCAGATS
jgi:tripartite-type tricarboxylate transporter receptor subunit TctC